jgi:hypothetical protein
LFFCSSFTAETNSSNGFLVDIDGVEAVEQGQAGDRAERKPDAKCKAVSGANSIVLKIFFTEKWEVLT